MDVLKGKVDFIKPSSGSISESSKICTGMNKPQLTKIKQQNCIGIRAFDSRLYLDISRSFK
jgi:hypothetical protein